MRSRGMEPSLASSVSSYSDNRSASDVDSPFFTEELDSCSSLETLSELASVSVPSAASAVVSGDMGSSFALEAMSSNLD